MNTSFFNQTSTKGLTNLHLLGNSSNPPDHGHGESKEFSLTWPLIAGVFALASVLLSLEEVYKHLLYYNKPYLQKYVVRILGMVPIYALNSWFAMFFPSIAIYMDAMRECYEAFVIYSFMKYLFNFLSYEVAMNEIVIDCKPPVENLFPVCFLPPLPGGRRFLRICRHGMIQFIIIRPITTFLALFFHWTGSLGEGEFNFSHAYLYLLIINNITQMIAMYCLVIFYYNYKAEFAPMQPLGKFLCIKLLVFVSFFQGVLLSICIRLGIITHSIIPISMEDYGNFELARNLQDFLICFEMLVAAIAHKFIFSHKPFYDVLREPNPMFLSFSRALDLTDERTDVYDHLRHLGSRVRTIWKQPSGAHSSYESIEEHSAAPLIPLKSMKSSYGGTRA